MKLSESIERKGFFWLPENPEAKLPGVLRISEIGEVKLEIFYLPDKSKHKITGSDRMDGDKIVTISGIVDQEYVTLYKFIKGKKNHHHYLAPGVSNMICYFDFALLGFNYKKEKDIMLSKMIFSIEGLREWLYISGVKTEYDSKSENSAIYFKNPSNITICTHEKFNLEIIFNENSNLGPFEANMTQEVCISITSKNLRPLDEFLDIIWRIHCFLCFAIDRMVYIKSITSYSTAQFKKIQDDNMLVPIKIYYKSFPFSEGPTNIHRYGMLFRYHEINDQFNNIMKKWIQNYSIIKPVFDLYFTSASMFDTYSTERFLLLIRSVEVFHRNIFVDEGKKFPENEFNEMKSSILSIFSKESTKKSFLKEKMSYANEITLKERIRKMIYPFRDLYGLDRQETDSLIKNIGDMRNCLTHYGDQYQKLTTTEGDMYKLCIKLEALLQLHFLQLIGVDTKIIQTIATTNNHLRHKLDFN